MAGHRKRARPSNGGGNSAPRGTGKPNASPSGTRARKRGGGAAGDEIWIYGLHAVRAALDNPMRKRKRLLASANALSRLGPLPDELGVEEVEARAIDAILPRDAVHQGVALLCESLALLDASELFHLADTRLILALDQITDPHNVGAILRSAVAMQVDAVLVTHRNAAAETGALAKAASGALDMVRLIDLRNLSKGLDELREMGFAVIGLDSDGEADLNAVLKDRPPEKAVLVLGAEGRGLREKTREACTTLARLDMPGAIRSLNVSNAAALSLYLTSQAVRESDRT